MKLPVPITVFTASTVAGFAAIVVGLELAPRFQLGVRSPPGRPETAEAHGTDREDKNAPSASSTGATGPKYDSLLADRLLKVLEPLGIDASWAELLAMEETSSFPELLGKMASLSGGQRERLRELLLGRWVMLDPLGGAEFFNSISDENGLSDLFRQWQRLDFPAAAAHAGAYSEAILRRTLRDKARLDPAGLLAWLAQRPELNPLSFFGSGGSENTEALTRLAEIDPAKMLVWTQLVPEEKWDNAFISSLAGQLAKKGPDVAIAWAKSLKDAGRSAAALGGVAKTLAPAQPERAVALLGELPAADDFDMRRLKMEVISELDLKNPDKALALAKLLPKGEIRSSITRNTLYSLLESNPAKAFATADSVGLEAGRNDSFAVPPAMQTAEGARQLLEAAGNVKSSVYVENAAKTALLSWMDRDSASLAAYLEGKMGSPLLSFMRGSLQDALATQQLRDGKADPEMTAVVGLPPELYLKKQAEFDPAVAAAALDTVSDPAVRHEAAEEIAKAYARLDRGDAMAWAETVTDPEVQASAWKAIAAGWVEEDSWQASEWIAKLPAGKGRDGAVLSMAEGIQKTDPDLAWKWALSMSDPILKNQALAAAAQAWSRKDSSALHEALNDGTLSGAEQLAILENLNKDARPNSSSSK